MLMSRCLVVRYLLAAISNVLPPVVVAALAVVAAGVQYPLQFPLLLRLLLDHEEAAGTITTTMIGTLIMAEAVPALLVAAAVEIVTATAGGVAGADHGTTGRVTVLTKNHTNLGEAQEAVGIAIVEEAEEAGRVEVAEVVDAEDVQDEVGVEDEEDAGPPYHQLQRPIGKSTSAHWRERDTSICSVWHLY